MNRIRTIRRTPLLCLLPLLFFMGGGCASRSFTRSIPPEKLPSEIPFGEDELRIGKLDFSYEGSPLPHFYNDMIVGLVRSQFDCSACQMPAATKSPDIERENDEQVPPGQSDGQTDSDSDRLSQKNQFILDLDAVVNVDAQRTYYLDAISLFPFLGSFPLVPEWGTVSVRLTGHLRNAEDGALIGSPVRAKARAPYNIFFYSFFRKGAINDALWYAYSDAAHGMAQLMVADAKAKRMRPQSDRLGQRPDRIADGAGSAGGAEEYDYHHAIPQLTDDWHVVSHATLAPTERMRLMPWYLSALGGLDAGLFMGAAKVWSNVSDDTGHDRTIASGEATSKGIRIALYAPPARTGWFFPPMLGFLSQEIDIVNLGSDLRAEGYWQPGHIPATISDPETGEEIDPAKITTEYRLLLRSFYLGQGIGHNLVVSKGPIRLFSTLRAGINLVELRHFTTISGAERLGVHHSDHAMFMDRSSQRSFSFLQSGGINLQAGIYVPKYHAALRVTFAHERYRKFDFPEAVPVQGFTEGHTEIGAASLSTSTIGLSGIVVF